MAFLNHSSHAQRIVKVLVVPIGENSQFDATFELLCDVKSCAKDEIRKLSNEILSKESEDCPFQSNRWRDGSILFDYVRYDVMRGHIDDINAGGVEFLHVSVIY